MQPADVPTGGLRRSRAVRSGFLTHPAPFSLEALRSADKRSVLQAGSWTRRADASEASFTHLSASLSPPPASQRLRFPAFRPGLNFTPQKAAHGVKTGV